MLKFPRSLDEIDPLPRDIGTADRWLEEWERAIEREDGTDWKKIPGKLYWFRNGKGQLRYAPPLPSTPPKEPTSYNWEDNWEGHP